MKMLIMNIHIIFMIVIVDGYQNKEFKEIQLNILMKFIIQIKNKEQDYHLKILNQHSSLNNVVINLFDY